MERVSVQQRSQCHWYRDRLFIFPSLFQMRYKLGDRLIISFFFINVRQNKLLSESLSCVRQYNVSAVFPRTSARKTTEITTLPLHSSSIKQDVYYILFSILKRKLLQLINVHLKAKKKIYFCGKIGKTELFYVSVSLFSPVGMFIINITDSTVIT